MRSPAPPSIDRRGRLGERRGARRRRGAGGVPLFAGAGSGCATGIPGSGRGCATGTTGSGATSGVEVGVSPRIVFAAGVRRVGADRVVDRVRRGAVGSSETRGSGAVDSALFASATGRVLAPAGVLAVGLAFTVDPDFAALVVGPAFAALAFAAGFALAVDPAPAGAAVFAAAPAFAGGFAFAAAPDFATAPDFPAARDSVVEAGLATKRPLAARAGFAAGRRVAPEPVLRLDAEGRAASRPVTADGSSLVLWDGWGGCGFTWRTCSRITRWGT